MDPKTNTPQPAIRVCLLTSSYHPIIGGGESHARLLSGELVNNNVSVFILTQRILKNTAKYEILDQVPVYRVGPANMLRWGKYLMMLPGFIKLIRLRQQYDIIYVCGLRILGILGIISSRILNKKCILRSESLGEMSGDFVWGSPNPPKRSLVVQLIKMILAMRDKMYFKADCFLSISGAISEEFIECRIPPHKIKLIPNGIDIARFSPLKDGQKLQLREEYNLSDGIIFCYTGKLNRMKGLELLLSVWNEIVQECPNAYLLLVGSGGFQVLSCESELRAFVADNNLQPFVRFTGYTENAEQYLQCSDVFVLPSESESLSLSLLEAMSCQLPAIATRCGGPNDIIEHGSNGLLVDVNSFSQLKTNMIDTIKNHDKYKSMAERGRATVLKKFSIQKVARDHIALFESILE